jgi:hypothetical protein
MLGAIPSVSTLDSDTGPQCVSRCDPCSVACLTSLQSTTVTQHNYDMHVIVECIVLIRADWHDVEKEIE